MISIPMRMGCCLVKPKALKRTERLKSAANIAKITNKFTCERNEVQQNAMLRRSDTYEGNAHVDEVVAERPMSKFVAENSKNLFGLAALVCFLLASLFVVRGLSVRQSIFFNGGFFRCFLNFLVFVLATANKGIDVMETQSTYVIFLLLETVAFDQCVVENNTLGFEEAIKVRIGMCRSGRT